MILLYVYFGGFVGEVFIFFKYGLYAFLKELGNLLGASSRIVLGDKHCFDILTLESKGGVCKDTVDKVVFKAFFLPNIV